MISEMVPDEQSEQKRCSKAKEQQKCGESTLRNKKEATATGVVRKGEAGVIPSQRNGQSLDHRALEATYEV